MLRNYALAASMFMLLFSMNSSAQSAKPQPTAGGKEQMRPGFTRAHPTVDFRGGGGNTCASANPLVVSSTCNPATFDAALATQSQAAIACNGYTSPAAKDLWFSFTATSATSTVTVNGVGDFDAVIQFFSGSCGALISMGCQDAGYPPANTVETVSFGTFIGQTYYVRVYSFSNPVPLSSQFSICVTHQSGGGTTPPNDFCTGAVPQDLSVGSTVTFSGNNTGATLLDGTEYVVVWEAFILSTCATVELNYCLPGFVFGDFLINLATQCPEVLNGTLAGVVANNCTVTFTELQPGTYYIPVLVDAAFTPVGDYSISASAVACPPGYCSASAISENPNLEMIANVSFADFNNPSTSPVGFEDFTAVVGSVTQNSIQDIAVTIANGYDDDEVLVWIDFDQSESFEANELVYTSPLGPGPHSGTIAIPEDAALGQTRMRIRLHDSVLGGNPAPCGTSSYGQVEDYTVNIDLSTGIPARGPMELSVFPNPSTGELFIRHNTNGMVLLDVMDISGQVVYSTQRNAVRGEMERLSLTGKLAVGTYILRVSGADGRAEQRVVIR